MMTFSNSSYHSDHEWRRLPIYLIILTTNEDVFRFLLPFWPWMKVKVIEVALNAKSNIYHQNKFERNQVANVQTQANVQIVPPTKSG